MNRISKTGLLLSFMMGCPSQAWGVGMLFGSHAQEASTESRVTLAMGEDGQRFLLPRSLACRLGFVTATLDFQEKNGKAGLQRVVIPSDIIDAQVLSKLLSLVYEINQCDEENHVGDRVRMFFPNFKSLLRAYQATAYLDIPEVQQEIVQELALRYFDVVKTAKNCCESALLQERMTEAVQNTLLQTSVIKDLLPFMRSSATIGLTALLRELREHLVRMLKGLDQGERLLAAFNDRHDCDIARTGSRLDVLVALAQEVADRNLCIMWHAIIRELGQGTGRPAAHASASDIRAWINHQDSQIFLNRCRRIDCSFIEKLTMVSQEIQHFSQVEDIFLQNNDLIVLPREIGALKNLRTFFLSNNRLIGLPSEIEGLHSLKILSLDNNQLRALPPQIGTLQQLEALYLDNNRLKALPVEIENLQALQNLSVNRNQLTQLPESIAKLNRLHLFDIRANKLSAETVALVRRLLSDHCMIYAANQSVCRGQYFISLIALVMAIYLIQQT